MEKVQRRVQAKPSTLKGIIPLAPRTIMHRFRLPETDPQHLPNTKNGKYRYFNPDELKQCYYKEK